MSNDSKEGAQYIFMRKITFKDDERNGLLNAKKRHVPQKTCRNIPPHKRIISKKEVETVHFKASRTAM